MTGSFLGASLDASGLLEQAWMRGQGASAAVTTTNYTLLGAGGLIGREYASGGDTFHYSDFNFQAGASATDPEVAMFRAPGKSAELVIDAFTAQLRSSPVDTLRETPRVNSARPTYEENVGGTLQVTMPNVDSFRLRGSFMISVWAWNFTIGDALAQQTFVTGSYRQPIQPSAPSNSIYTEFAQVAQIQIDDGELEVGGLSGAQLASFSRAFQAAGYGAISAVAATSLATDSSGLQLQDSTLEANGLFEVSMKHEQNVAALQLSRLEGDLAIDGRGVPLGREGPLQPSTQLADQNPFSNWAWPLGLIALIAFAVAVKGPAMTGRFNRIQMRFDQHDYVGVLDRIESFTHRPKYARRASFLKAVSLLSLNEFKEASLYLQTLAPHEAPEPATKAFLQACAAAGLGQDSTAINHLSECLKDDPSYIEEAKAVPALVGYLPYFSISPGEAAT